MDEYVRSRSRISGLRQVLMTRKMAMHKICVRAALAAGVLLLLGVLMLPTSAAVRADGLATLEAVFGTVLRVSAGEAGGVIWLATDDGVVALEIQAGTTLKAGDAETTLDGVAEADRIVATAERGAEGTLIGQSVIVRPKEGGASYLHVVGVVTGVGDARIEVTDRNGNTVTLEWPVALEEPAVGEMITAVARRDERTNSLMVKALERAERTVKRLESALERVEDPAKKREIQTLIERNGTRHLTALNEALANVSAETGAQVVAAVARFGQEYARTALNAGTETPGIEDGGVVTGLSGDVLSVRLSHSGVERQFLLTAATEIETALSSAATPFDLLSEGRRVSVLTTAADVAEPPVDGPPRAVRVSIRPPQLPGAVAAAVAAESPQVFYGSITLVDVGSGLAGVDGVVIVADVAEGTKVAANVRPGTKISLDGEPADVGKLAAGQRAEVWLTGDGVTATQLRVSLEERPEAHLSGVVRRLDTEGRSILVAPVSGEPVELRIAPDAGITRNGQDVGLSEVGSDDLVLGASSFDPETRVVNRLVVSSLESVNLAGTVAGVNEAAGRVTVRLDNGGTTTVRVTEDTELDGPEDRAVLLSDLQVGDRVVAGQYRPVDTDGLAFNVATELAVAPPEIDGLRGVVVLLDEVHNGAGRIMVDDPDREQPVKLFVSHPASRVAVFKDGRQTNGLESIEIGDIVESAAYEPGTGALARLTVVTPGAERIRGVVSSVDPVAGALAVVSSDGDTVRMVTAGDAEIRLNGRLVGSLAGIETGDTVAAALYAEEEPGQISALGLHVLSGRRVVEAVTNSQEPYTSGRTPVAMPGPVETTISGVIELIDGDRWVIGGREFVVTKATQFFGEEPEPGLVAKAALRAGEDGAFTALAVSVAGKPSENPERRPINVKPGSSDAADGTVLVSGVIRSIAGNVWTIEGVAFVVTDGTRIVGAPEVGREARVSVRREADGTSVAVEVVLGAVSEASATRR